MTNDRTMNFKWTYPDFPPRPIEREVMFALMYYGNSLYFVNQSDEALYSVSTESFGFVEDSALINNPICLYKDVKPSESVKVEEYDGYYDLDYVLGFQLYIHSERLGKIKITPPAKKGGVQAQELLFEDMTTPRYVGFSKIEDTE